MKGRCQAVLALHRVIIDPLEVDLTLPHIRFLRPLTARTASGSGTLSMNQPRGRYSPSSPTLVKRLFTSAPSDRRTTGMCPVTRGL